MTYKFVGQTYKIEEYRSGSWVGVASTYPPNQYTGFTEDQAIQDAIDYLVTVGISSTNLRATEE